MWLDLTEIWFFSFAEGVKERDRLKEKQSRDFLRIKLKEKKKIRKTTSGEENLHLFMYILKALILEA